MATLTIRGIDDDTKTRLRIQAARNGRSMEEEVRTILRASLSEPPAPDGLGTRLHSRFVAIGATDLAQPPRTDRPRPAVFEQ